MNWTAIQNYSGTKNFEELQDQMEMIYDVSVSELDYRTRHPICHAKLLHIIQMILSYYIYTDAVLVRDLQNFKFGFEKTTQQISKLESDLQNSKIKIKKLQDKVKLETKAKQRFIEQQASKTVIQCAFCPEKTDSKGQFQYHMKLKHKDHFVQKKFNTIFKALQNQLLQQQINMQIEKQQHNQLLVQEYNLVKKTKLQLAEETNEFMEQTYNIKKQIEITRAKHEKEIEELKQEIQMQVDVICENQQQDEHYRMEILNEKLLDIDVKFNEFEQQIQQIPQHRQRTDPNQSSGSISRSQMTSSIQMGSQSQLGTNRISLTQLPLKSEHILSQDHQLGRGFARRSGEFKQPVDTFANIHSDEDEDEDQDHDDEYEKHISDLNHLHMHKDIFHNMILDLLVNKNNGIRIQYTEEQYKEISKLLDELCMPSLMGYEDMDENELHRLQRELRKNNKNIQNRIKIEMKSGNQSINDEDEDEVEDDSAAMSLQYNQVSAGMISHSRQTSNQLKQIKFK